MKSFWSQSPAEAFKALGSDAGGLGQAEAARRLAASGPNILATSRNSGPIVILLRQFASPIVLILIAAAIISGFIGDLTDAGIILAIVLISGLLGFWQEYSADHATEKLMAMVRLKSTVRRGGVEQDVPVEEVVPGDIVLLKAGDVVPADGLLLTLNSLFVDEAALTGETFPVEKSLAPVAEEAALAKRTNALWMGTHVVSGQGELLIAQTGARTEFGQISVHFRNRPAETDFERGIRHFGMLLLEITLVLVAAIFIINVAFQRPALESFLFSVALAVGLTPQLLPAIVSINLAHGARQMAAHKTIVKRLSAIENIGSMNMLCSDKTGTLTDGTVVIQGAYDLAGQKSLQVMQLACVNAAFESGFINPIDQAIRAQSSDLTGWKKLDEQPYDFNRKRLSVLAQSSDGRHLMVSKGALRNILAVCTKAQNADGQVVPIDQAESLIEQQFRQLSDQGHRVLGVAWKDCGSEDKISWNDEQDLVFAGLLALYDPLKNGIKETIDRLTQLGVKLKVITGDNALVAQNVMKQLGRPDALIMTGEQLHQMNDDALRRNVVLTDVFAEIEPNQKDRIILALKRSGAVVGYMGDGINDAAALHDADVGISVDSAVDVAKEAADIVLLEHDLNVLIEGVIAGRRTFSNTMKYIFMATSANFGNMFSMAGASLFLSFLPLLPKQVLLTNLLTDFPEMTIAGDHVDPEQIETPRRWDLGFIRRFMLTFGLISSLFDFLTFGMLMWFARASETQFHTGWFIESVVSASLIVLVMRTRLPFFRSPPSRPLLLATLSVIGLVLLLPLTPLASALGFTALPAWMLLLIGLIVMLYIAVAEVAKHFFYRKQINR